MIYKIIHRNFEINLLDFLPEIVEENQWFSSNIFARYSFPFEVELTKELDQAFGNLSHKNSDTAETYLEVELYKMNKRHIAILEVEGIDDDIASIKIYYGLEEFPSFKKKLSELSLHKENLENISIYDFAESKINVGWPQINYNFPKVFPPEEMVDTSSEQWEHFQGFINNRTANGFIENEFDNVNFIQFNRNIIQPMPYLMHILETGFKDAGYELKGDVLEDNFLKKVILENESEYYRSINSDSKVFLMKTDEFNGYYDNWTESASLNGDSAYRSYEGELIIDKPGYYSVAGNVTNRTVYSYAISIIKINDDVKFKHDTVKYFKKYFQELKSVEFTFHVPPGETATIQFASNNLSYSKLNDEIITDDTIFDVSIVQLSKYDSSGNVIPTLITPDIIDLTKAVPDKKFGDLVKALLAFRNYELVPGDPGTFEMNRITPKIKEPSSKSLEHTEKKKPPREFQRGKSFLLKYQDVESEKYKFPSVFVDKEGGKSDSFKENDETSEIILDFIPLPQKTSDGVTTADSFIDQNNSLKFIVYNHISQGNLTEETSEFEMINIYEKDYQEWLRFRIFSQIYKWDFILPIDEMLLMSVYKKYYAYGRNHIPKKITKSVLSKDWGEIEIETES